MSLKISSSWLAVTTAFVVTAFSFQIVRGQQEQTPKRYGMVEEPTGLPLLAKMNFYGGAPNTHVIGGNPKTGEILTDGVTLDRLVPVALGVKKGDVDIQFDPGSEAYHVFIKTTDGQLSTSRDVLKVLLTDIAHIHMEKDPASGRWKATRIP